MSYLTWNVICRHCGKVSFTFRSTSEDNRNNMKTYGIGYLEFLVFLIFLSRLSNGNVGEYFFLYFILNWSLVVLSHLFNNVLVLKPSLAVYKLYCSGSYLVILKLNGSGHLAVPLSRAFLTVVFGKFIRYLFMTNYRQLMSTNRKIFLQTVQPVLADN